MADCTDCGQEHKATQPGARPCMGHISTGPKGQPMKDNAGQPCRKPAMAGLDVCASHGGRNPAAKAAGRRRAAEASAERVMRRFGEPIDTTPSEALLDTVKWTAGYVAWLRDKVATVTRDEKLIWGQTRRKLGGHDTGTTHEAKPNAWLTLLGGVVRPARQGVRGGDPRRHRGTPRPTG